MHCQMIQRGVATWVTIFTLGVKWTKQVNFWGIHFMYVFEKFQIGITIWVTVELLQSYCLYNRVTVTSNYKEVLKFLDSWNEKTHVQATYREDPKKDIRGPISNYHPKNTYLGDMNEDTEMSTYQQANSFAKDPLDETTSIFYCSQREETIQTH